MTTPAQAADRKIEMLVEEIINTMVIFGAAEKGFWYLLGIESVFEKASLAHRVALGKVHFAVCLLSQSEREQVIDEIKLRGWDAEVQGMTGINVGAPKSKINPDLIARLEAKKREAEG